MFPNYLAFLPRRQEIHVPSLKSGLTQVAQSGPQFKWCYRTEKAGQKKPQSFCIAIWDTHIWKPELPREKSDCAMISHAVEELRPQGEVTCMCWGPWPGTRLTASPGSRHVSEDPSIGFQPVPEATPAFKSSTRRSQTSWLGGKTSFWGSVWILDPKICEQNKKKFFFFGSNSKRDAWHYCVCGKTGFIFERLKTYRKL